MHFCWQRGRCSNWIPALLLLFPAICLANPTKLCGDEKCEGMKIARKLSLCTTQFELPSKLSGCNGQLKQLVTHSFDLSYDEWNVWVMMIRAKFRNIHWSPFRVAWVPEKGHGSITTRRDAPRKEEVHSSKRVVCVTGNAVAHLDLDVFFWR